MIIRSRKDKAPYILKQDREQENPPVFMFKMMTKKQFVQFALEIQSTISIGDGNIMSPESVNFMYDKVAQYLVGWEGVKDEDGKDVKFDAKKLSEVLEDVEFEVVSELFAAITEVNGLTGDEAKNSD